MIRLLAAVSAAALAVAAGAAQAAPHRTALTISTAPGMAMKYSTGSLRAKAGLVTISMRNTQPIPHDVAIKGHGVHAKGKLVTRGGVSVVTARLRPGRYEFYCTVPGHEQAGMKGTLIVS
ncbi:MAG TPA: plastocyanin/azurin family copper-binding protein [Gaiellaceae bacterium]|jgi:plastocyanin